MPGYEVFGASFNSFVHEGGCQIVSLAARSTHRQCATYQCAHIAALSKWSRTGQVEQNIEIRFCFGGDFNIRILVDGSAR